MDENVRFQSDAHYALPQYKEFCALNIYAHFRNSFLHLLATVCILFLIYMLRLNISPVTLLLLNLFCLGLHLLRRFRDRDGIHGRKACSSLFRRRLPLPRQTGRKKRLGGS